MREEHDNDTNDDNDDDNDDNDDDNDNDDDDGGAASVDLSLLCSPPYNQCL